MMFSNEHGEIRNLPILCVSIHAPGLGKGNGKVAEVGMRKVLPAAEIAHTPPANNRAPGISSVAIDICLTVATSSSGDSYLALVGDGRVLV